MRVIVAPDSQKQPLTAIQAARAIRRGVLAARPEARVDLCPVSDGGEGFVTALVRATGGEIVRTHVTGPLGGFVQAAWALLGDGVTAAVEMAPAAGLDLVPGSRPRQKSRNSFAPVRLDCSNAPRASPTGTEP